jgi:nicotinamidase-related amidase
MQELPRHTVLLPIDMQRGFDEPSWPRRSNPLVDQNGRQLLAAWRKADRPIIHVRHDSIEPGSSLAPGRPGHDFRPGFAPEGGEACVAKSVNAAFIGTDLDLRLRRLQAEVVVVFGLTTDMCVSTTVRIGANLGWRMVVAGDACAAFDQRDAEGGAWIEAETVHRVHLATLAAEFAMVASTRSIIAALG